MGQIILELGTLGHILVTASPRFQQKFQEVKPIPCVDVITGLESSKSSFRGGGGGVGWEDFCLASTLS